jgi:hypothetical protein
MKPTVDIGIACGNNQPPPWWKSLMGSIKHEIQENGLDIVNIFAISSALPDHNKNHAITSVPLAPIEYKKRNSLTDANRQAITKRFMDNDSDWIMLIDDDTTHLPGTISHLLSLGKPMVGGLYFNPKEPYNPIAYVKEPGEWHYVAFSGYTKGALTEIDAIGMGCTLIHRGVFEQIQDAHVVYQRANGSLFPVHKDRIEKGSYNINKKHHGNVVGDSFVMPVQKLELKEEDNRAFPFFALEYGRTEDMHFCELAANVGIKPWVDTNVVCKHWKYQNVGEKEYLAYMKEKSKEYEDHGFRVVGS